MRIREHLETQVCSRTHTASQDGRRTCLDLHTVKFGGKLVVDCKHVTILDLLRLGLLGENPLSGFPTGQ